MIRYDGLSCADLGITNPVMTALEPNLRYYNVRSIPEFRIYGVMESKNGGSFVRMPEDVAERTNPGVVFNNTCTAGGRIRFVTDSDYIAIRLTHENSLMFRDMSVYAATGLDVYMSRSGRPVFLGNIKPPAVITGGYGGMLRNELSKGRKEITVYLPSFNIVSDIYIGLDRNSELSAHPDYKIEKPVVYYGSSITHGACASRPGLAYPSIISRRYGVNYVNLGFAGSAKAEDAMCDYLASLDPSVFVLDYDYNAPSTEYLKNTHEKLYLTFREKHPDTPVVIVSRPAFKKMGPDSELRRRIVYESFKNADDRREKVVYVDGYGICCGYDRDDCTVDGVHPNDLGMSRMADAIGQAVDYALSVR